MYLPTTVLGWRGFPPLPEVRDAGSHLVYRKKEVICERGHSASRSVTGKPQAHLLLT